MITEAIHNEDFDFGLVPGRSRSLNENEKAPARKRTARPQGEFSQEMP
jgi:hypothetical protein